MVFASRSNRYFRAGSADISFGKILIATSRPSRESLARYTSPIPPAPSSPATSWGPSFVPGARGIKCRDYNLRQTFWRPGVIVLPQFEPIVVTTTGGLNGEVISTPVPVRASCLVQINLSTILNIYVRHTRTWVPAL